MATTRIQDGFDGGSDNQLKINADGSINVNGGGGSGSNVNITSVGGNPVTTSLPVSQQGFSDLSPGYPTQVTVGITSVQLLPANSARKYAYIFNNSTEAIFIQYQVSAALNQGIKINPGTLLELNTSNLWLGIINGIGYIANQMISVLDGE